MFTELSALSRRPHLRQAGRRMVLPALTGLTLVAIHTLEAALIANLNVYGSASALRRATGIIAGLELSWRLGLSLLGYSCSHLLRGLA